MTVGIQQQVDSGHSTLPLSLLMITHQRRFKARPRSHAMAKSLVKRGHSVDLIVIADSRRVGVTEDDRDGVRVIETPDALWGRLRSGWDPWNTLNRLVYLRRHTRSYQLVHCFETRPATIYPALSFCRRNGLPFVTDWNDWWGRGGIIDSLRPPWYRHLFGAIETYYEEAFRTRAAGLTAISSALVERAEQLGVAPENICHLSGGVEADLFACPEKLVCRERLGLSPSDPVIGFSSLDSHLDLELVFQALTIVIRSYPGLKFLMTGSVPAGLLKRAEDLGLASHLVLPGFLPYRDLPWHLGSADLFLLPFPDTVYNRGRWPNKICEYMSLGRPTVSNPAGDIEPLFQRHAVGLLTESTPAAFADSILELLRRPSLAEELGRNARETALRVYDWSVLGGRLERFYYNTLDGLAGSYQQIPSQFSASP